MDQSSPSNLLSYMHNHSHFPKEASSSQTSPNTESCLTPTLQQISTLIELDQNDTDEISHQLLENLLTQMSRRTVKSSLHKLPIQTMLILVNVLQSLIQTSSDTEDLVGGSLSSLICLHLMTADNIPNQVRHEDLISEILTMIKSTTTNPHLTRKIVTLLNGVLDLLCTFIESHNLPQTLLIKLTDVCMSSFFCKFSGELRLNAMGLLANIYHKFEVDWSIRQDIYMHLSKLPSSERILRDFRFCGGEGIQMISALVVQCVQSVSHNHPYETILSHASDFVSIYTKLCFSKGDDDYRPVMENFMIDLITASRKPECPVADLILIILLRNFVETFSSKGELTTRLYALDLIIMALPRIHQDMEGARLTQVFNMPKDDDFYLTIYQQFMKCLSNHQQKSASDFMMRKLEYSLKKAGKTKHGLELDTSQEWSYSKMCEHSAYVRFKSPFCNNFDILIRNVIVTVMQGLSEPAANVRSKVGKFLSSVVEVDYSIFGREDVQTALKKRVMDSSASVRESVVDLVGKFIKMRPTLIDFYYEMLSGRIMDLSLSVRKKVIKIFFGICRDHQDHPRVPDMCLLIARRIKDEEKKLVSEVFVSLWFVPTTMMIRRVATIIDVVAAFREEGGLLYQLFSVVIPDLGKGISVAQELVSCIVDNVLAIDESVAEGKSCGEHKIGLCFEVLEVISAVEPSLIVPHMVTLVSYLNCYSDDDLILSVLGMFHNGIMRMNHHGDDFLAQLEELIIKILLFGGPMVLCSAVKFLSKVVDLSGNMRLVEDFFGRVYKIIITNLGCHVQDCDLPHMRRCIYIIGNFCRHFDLQEKENVFNVLYDYTIGPVEELHKVSIMSLGIYMLCSTRYILDERIKTLYCGILESDDDLSLEVVNNIDMLINEGDISDVRSDVAQTYIKHVLACSLKPSLTKSCLDVLYSVAHYGLVHPHHIGPHIIALGFSDLHRVRTRARSILRYLEQKEPGFVHTRALAGLRLAYNVSSSDIVCDHVYLPQKSVKKHRRSFIDGIISCFDTTNEVTLGELLFLARNVAGLNFSMIDEPLYVIYQIDLQLSISGTEFVQSLRELFFPDYYEQGTMDKIVADGLDIDSSVMIGRVPSDGDTLLKYFYTAQSFNLLMDLRNYLKQSYGLTDSKVKQYSPANILKMNDRQVSRRDDVVFYSKKATWTVASGGNITKRKMVLEFIQFRKRFDMVTECDDSPPKLIKV